MNEVILTKFLSLSEDKQQIILEYMAKLLKEEQNENILSFEKSE